MLAVASVPVACSVTVLLGGHMSRHAILLTLIGLWCACGDDDRGTIAFTWFLEKLGAPFACAPESVVLAFAWGDGPVVEATTRCELGAGSLLVPPGRWNVLLLYSEDPDAMVALDPVVGGTASD